MNSSDENQEHNDSKTGLWKKLLRFNIREILLIVVIMSFGLAWFTNREDWNPDVLRLFSLEERDDALQKLLAEGKYPPKPRYTEYSVTGKVVGVVVCPQKGRPPLVTVLVGMGTQTKSVSSRRPRMIVFRSDGTILPWYMGANVLEGELLDLNGDGAIDWIEEINMGYPEGEVTTVHVVPIQEPFVSTFVLVWKKKSFDWKLNNPRGGIPTIQIGTKKGSGFDVVAEYSWSPKDERRVGPRGSADLGFIVADGGDTQIAVSRLYETE